MSPRTLVAGALAAVLLAVVLIGLGGDDPYTVAVPLENASGLQDGAAVKIGGLDKGKVKLRLGDDDRVTADLEFEDGAGPIGRDAEVAVVAANFLGLKRVEVTTGDVAGQPAPSGFELQRSQVTTPTDLDQVLGVFDADTRTRAKILLTAAGEAVVGRRVDIAELFKQFPVGLEDAQVVLDQLATDDRAMASLVTRSDRFVRDVTAERRALTKMVETVGETAQTVGARRAELRATLARAPGTLRSLRGFLTDLESTTEDLGPAARELSASAPALAATLREVDGFREAANPTLRQAAEIGPDLSALAKGATPVLRRARPAVQVAAAAATSLQPVSDTLDRSSDNIIAILENWSRAIQFRDQLGHVFRGEASFSPDLILTMVDRLARKPKAKRERQAPARRPQPAPAPKVTERLPEPVRRAIEKLPKLPLPQLDELLDRLPVKPTVEQVDKALDKILGREGAPTAGSPEALLDLLLGP